MQKPKLMHTGFSCKFGKRYDKKKFFKNFSIPISHHLGRHAFQVTFCYYSSRNHIFKGNYELVHNGYLSLYKCRAEYILHLNLCFSAGRLYFLDDKGNMSQSVTVDGPVKKLLYNSHRNVLVAITKTLVLSQYSVSQDGKLTEMMKVWSKMALNRPVH